MRVWSCYEQLVEIWWLVSAGDGCVGLILIVTNEGVCESLLWERDQSRSSHRQLSSPRQITVLVGSLH